MQQTINFEPSAQARQPLDVLATTRRTIHQHLSTITQHFNRWLDQKSEFYSRICEFSVTRRLAIRINLVSLCMIIGAVAIEQQPVTSAISALCAAYLVYRINQSDKEGGENE